MLNKDQRIITILGSTGSIGMQAIDVISAEGCGMQAGWLTGNKNIELLEQQAKSLNPKGIAIADEASYFKFRKQSGFSGEVLCGEEGLIAAASDPENDLVLSSLVGFAGVLPTLAAINQGTEIALANKETLVSAGGIITEAARKNKVRLLAVDSEHSAVLQCLAGERPGDIEKIILTASGGPFRETPREMFSGLTVKQALDHPNWSMGAKITIDSATMMNKGFEIIEAYWLFNVEIEKIDVLIHPQSIIHSMVQFVDGSIKAQLGLPDMRLPISYALSYPVRNYHDFPRLDLAEIGSLSFYKPDFDKFTCLQLAYEAVEFGGSAPAVLNAANEVAVYAFLDEAIDFNYIPYCIETALNDINISRSPSLEDIISVDRLTRQYVKQLISKFK